MSETTPPDGISAEDALFSQEVRRKLEEPPPPKRTHKWLADKVGWPGHVSGLTKLINLDIYVPKGRERKKWPRVIKERIAELLGISLAAIAQKTKGTVERVVFKLHPPLTGDCAGRDDERTELTRAWEDDRIKVLGVIGPPGVGKSTLVGHWLAEIAPKFEKEGVNVLVTSFSDEKGAERAVTADSFIARTLKELGDTDSPSGDPEEKAIRLHKRVRARRTFLWLDGLEALRVVPGSRDSQLSDEAIRALLVHLVDDNPGLCVVTSQLPIVELLPNKNKGYRLLDLDNLKPKGGACLLRLKGVLGDACEMEEVSRHYEGHCLTLDLIGGWLCETCKGDVRRWRDLPAITDIESAEERVGAILKVSEDWLKVTFPAALDLLRVVSLFDCPIDKNAVKPLLEQPIIGLTDRLVKLTENQWNKHVYRLCRLGLLAHPTNVKEDLLDAHAWVRDYYRASLRRDEVPWKEGNARLAKHLAAGIGSDQPEDEEEIHQLYRSVRHACEAGQFEEALAIYRRRINREDVARNQGRPNRTDRGREGKGKGNRKRGRTPTSDGRMPHPYAVWHRGLFQTDLATLKAFFQEPWEVPRSGLDILNVAYLQKQAGICLRLLGRYEEARRLTELAYIQYRSAGDHVAEATLMGYLAELCLLRGDLDKALNYAKASVKCADKYEDSFRRVYNRGIHGDILHELGKPNDARKIFQQAKRRQKTFYPEQPFLTSITAYRYLDVLFSQGDLQEVLRVLDHLKGGYEGRTDLDDAIERMFREMAEGSPNAPAQARVAFYKAVEDILSIGVREAIVIVLPDRARYKQAAGDYAAAQEDLERATDMAHRDGAVLYEVNARLRLAELHLCVGNASEAEKSLSQAQRIIDDVGYKRRRKELEVLQSRMRPA